MSVVAFSLLCLVLLLPLRERISRQYAKATRRVSEEFDSARDWSRMQSAGRDEAVRESGRESEK